jgi:3-hydroxybutyrate dehydrogenase
MPRLQGRTVIITGAARGQGLSHCVAFAREGARVVGVDVGDLSTVRSQVPEDSFLGIQADITQSEAVRDLVARTVDRFGTVDILVNNAGIILRGPLISFAEEDWDRIFAINLRAMFLTSKYALPHMMEQRYGKIINISSAGGIQGHPNAVAYDTSKAGVIHFTQCLAKEVAPHTINVNCICPGSVDTPMVRQLMIEDTKPGEDVDAAYQRFIDKTHLLKWPIPTEEISAAAVFLASDDARSITGHALVVDAGMSVTK